MLWVLFAAAAFAECAVPRTASELQARVGAAEAAWTEGPAAFQGAQSGVADLLACVNSPIPADTAARVLRLHGLAAFARRDMGDSAAAFAAARLADPALTLDDGYAGEGHPLRAVWDTPVAPGAARPLRAPLRGAVYVNGAVATSVPAQHPFVFQWVDGVQANAAVANAGALPSYPRAAHPAKVPLFVAAGTALVASGVLYGLAWTEYDRATQAQDLATLDAAESANHGYLVGSGVAGGVALVALGGAVVVARW